MRGSSADGQAVPDDPGRGRQLRDRRRVLARLRARRRRPADVDPRRALALDPPATAPRRSAPRSARPPFATLDVSTRAAAIHGDCSAIRSPVASSRRSSPRRSPHSRWRCSASRSPRSGSSATRATACSTSRSQGAGPRALRASVRWRALGLALPRRLAGVRPRHRRWRSRRDACSRSTRRSPCPIRRCSASPRGSPSPRRRAVLALLAAALVEAALRVAYRAARRAAARPGSSWAE